jgi:apolipoprotein D and lipocalin family protein
MFRRPLLLLQTLLAPLLAAACASGPAEGLTPVRFDAERYLGTWHEIARLDQSFQRGLEQVTATYSRNPDGTIRVVNRGLRTTTGEERSATARARFLREPEVASLAVSFLWPFEGGYHVIRLAPDYSIALVTSNDRSFLWLLSRTPTLPEPVVAEWLEFARARGFAVDTMIPARPAPGPPPA